MSDGEKPKSTDLPHLVKFTIAGLAGCSATLICHPIDVIKSRMQLSGERGSKRDHTTSIHAVSDVVKKEGYLALYSGFSANIARQLCYTTTRLSIYQICIEKLDERNITGIKAQIISGLIGGIIGSVLATPTDVALVRMTADNRLPPNDRRNYRHVVDAIVRIGKEEGVTGLWAGLGASIPRAALGTIMQLVSYVQTKQFLIDNDYVSDGPALHFIASSIAGLVYSFTTTPLDVAKTRLQQMKIVNGKPEYSGLMDCWKQIYLKEGATAFWKGFTPYYMKLGPNTIFLFMFTEYFIKMYKKYVLGDEKAKGGL